MQQQMAQQNQSAAPPAEATSQPDMMAAMMAELQALRAQVASQNQTAAAEQPAQPVLEDIVKEFGTSEETES